MKKRIEIKLQNVPNIKVAITFMLEQLRKAKKEGYRFDGEINLTNVNTFDVFQEDKNQLNEKPEDLLSSILKKQIDGNFEEIKGIDVGNNLKLLNK